MTAALIHVGRRWQFVEHVGAPDRLEFKPEEGSEIDRHAVEGGGPKLWGRASADWA